MPTTTLTAREFNQDSGRAKRAAMDGPVFITDRGSPSHVLLSIEEYQRLSGCAIGSKEGGDLIDRLSMPDGDDFDVVFDRPKTNSLKIPTFED
jgi:prevent-host-death family protein